jgi:hypothetical protein
LLDDAVESEASSPQLYLPQLFFFGFLEHGVVTEYRFVTVLKKMARAPVFWVILWVRETKKTRQRAPVFVFFAEALKMAGRTGIEPVTSDVTGRRSNQLNYRPRCKS